MSSQEEDNQFDQEYEQNNQQIDEFEQRYKQNQTSSEDEEHYQQRSLQQNSKVEQLPRPQNKIEAIQKQLEFYKKQPPKTLAEECEDVINSKNETLKDRKIRELVQKNRQLLLSYEKEKQSRKKLEEQVNKALKETDEGIKALDKSIPKAPIPKADPLAKALKGSESQKEDLGVADDFKNKFKEADKKVQEQRVKLQQVKTELNKAMRIIQREVGENANLDQLLMDENGWKGRAQQIEILKSKVKDLNSKLGSSSQYSDVSQMSKQSKSEAKNNSDKQQYELLKSQYEAVRVENENLQQKIKAVSSRRQILEDQIKDVKVEYEKNKKILLEKSENDDKYIFALKSELDKLKKNQPQSETKIVYKPADDEETRKLRQELKYCKEEIGRNEQMIKELIAEKVNRSKQELPQQQQQEKAQTKPVQTDERVKKLEEEIKALKRERDEFFKTLTKDVETQKMIKDLTMQNVKLRNKIDDLTKK
ncbi:unnamed protein product (macronuclear) [Paramecium tetraurelia]|uniref:Uncharacterized protein n=1 Tax=Paramecium tetraurelia TaxID=5888 RepID=A0C0X9_PARTE|nr:uncharacterized protein GSPATT00033922001 [Paramecium tetraurelia]CAK64446.1 unnamed protein product [Paramecium tetraurelia]|eukprot:XP_001431844.1 hypothetical protein (macronuclear) [Paramecium tetraurelia strain d4-2]